jgi:hypothetical protein
MSIFLKRWEQEDHTTDGFFWRSHLPRLFEKERCKTLYE